jgi:hypothetical protein
MYEYNVGVQTQLLDNAENIIKKERNKTNCSAASQYIWSKQK